MRRSKKADLNMSIQAIVIIVLAMTLLGLGINFIRGQFGSLTETTSSVQEQIKQQILDDLRTGNKKLSFPASEVTMERSDATVIAIGVKNTGNQQLEFKIDMGCTQEGIDFLYQADKPYTLSTADAQVYPIRVTAPATTGTFLCSVTILEGESIYAEKDFFINVVG